MPRLRLGALLRPSALVSISPMNSLVGSGVLVVVSILVSPEARVSVTIYDRGAAAGKVIDDTVASYFPTDHVRIRSRMCIS